MSSSTAPASPPAQSGFLQQPDRRQPHLPGQSQGCGRQHGSTPASYTWVVDTAAPDTAIDTAPPALTASTSASFTFHATEAGSSFQCSLDGAAYAACTSSASYSGLSDGSHTLRRQGHGRGRQHGSRPRPASAWVVDTVAPPAPSITSNPSNPTNQTSASFSFSDTEGGSQLPVQARRAARPTRHCGSRRATHGPL